MLTRRLFQIVAMGAVSVGSAFSTCSCEMVIFKKLFSAFLQWLKVLDVLSCAYCCFYVVFREISVHIPCPFLNCATYAFMIKLLNVLYFMLLVRCMIFQCLFHYMHWLSRSWEDALHHVNFLFWQVALLGL